LEPTGKRLGLIRGEHDPKVHSLIDMHNARFTVERSPDIPIAIPLGFFPDASNIETTDTRWHIYSVELR